MTYVAQGELTRTLVKDDDRGIVAPENVSDIAVFRVFRL